MYIPSFKKNYRIRKVNDMFQIQVEMYLYPTMNKGYDAGGEWVPVYHTKTLSMAEDFKKRLEEGKELKEIIDEYYA